MTLAAKAPDERRRRILAAAIAVLRDRGFSGTRVADIATTAGTSPALVLYHFSSLADVLVAALESVEDEYYDELERGGRATRVTGWSRWRQLSAEGGPAFGDWQLWIEVWVRALHDDRIDAVRRALDRRWREAIPRRRSTPGWTRACSRPPTPTRTGAAARLPDGRSRGADRPRRLRAHARLPWRGSG